jgi:rhomboid family protein
VFPLKDDNPTIHPPVVTIALIALIVLNVLVFLWQQTGDADLKIFRHAAIPYNITQGPKEVALLPLTNERGQIVNVERVSLERGVSHPDVELIRPALPPWLTLLSSMFMHGGWMHILGNMLFLWIFGNNIEDALGRLRFIVFYLGTGLAASFAHIFSEPMSVIPTLGASGAVSGILGGYILLYPRAQVLALIPLGIVMMTQRLPAFVFLGLWFLMQVFNLFGAAAGVAWYAHIGGFVVGLALVKIFESGEHRQRSAGDPLRLQATRIRDHHRRERW